MSTLEHYLANYAEPEIAKLDDFMAVYEQCLLIPAYNEPVENISYFLSFLESQRNCLLIFVINQTDKHKDTQWAEDLLPLMSNIEWRSNCKQLQLSNHRHGNAILWVDRCLTGQLIPAKQGVGLARKIANDIAAALHHRGQIKSPWLFNTDADARLPNDYFSAFDPNIKGIAAHLFPFTHTIGNTSKVNAATQLYELSLNYYVEALGWANSPYAYHSLGSIIAVHTNFYAAVRGFPKRPAGEDFYLLNKLAKTASIARLSTLPIQLMSRESDRVPFGTGPAVMRIATANRLNETPFYDPNIFVQLKYFLKQITLCLQEEYLDSAERALIKVCSNSQIQAAENTGVWSTLKHCYQQGKTAEKRLQHFHQGFDAFKTLKFVHQLRNTNYPMIPYQVWLKAIENSPYRKNLSILKIQ